MLLYMTILPIKQKYIETKFKTADSVSNSDLKIELSQSLTFPENSVFYIDDVSIPHSWYVIETGINDKLYMHVSDPDEIYNVYYSITIESGNYNGVDFANELMDKISFYVAPGQSNNLFVVTYSARQNNITIDNQNRLQMI